MKQYAAMMIVISMLLAVGVSGCNSQAGKPGGVEEGKISIVCTIFPQYDWVRQIMGDESENMELTLLLDSRIDLHNYQPSVDDIIKISDCDMFIYIGGQSDGWVDGILKDATNEDMVVINLLETLGDAVKIEEIVEGMEDDDHDHDDDHEEDEDDDHDEDHEDESEFDEHIWLSLKNAELLCAVITDALTSLDAGNADIYRSNLAAYIEKLAALDEQYRGAAEAANVDTLLFGDRFPFRYLVDDYGLHYYACFAGCSAETEAGFDTIMFLAGKVDELNLRSIMVTESSDKRIAETIIRESANKNQQILVLDAMQSVTSGDVRNGVTYLSIMESNLTVLKEALA